ncbi:MAG: transposase [Alphaproteobacteria bacterium]|nr:transposase [Alphaproteobacteria bacterium]
MSDTTLLPFSLPAIKLKKVIAAFDGARLSTDDDGALLALAGKPVGINGRLSNSGS